VLSRLEVGELCADPIARCSIGDGLAVRIDITRAGTVLEEQGDDSALFVLGSVRAGIALARVLDSEVQWGRAAPVHEPQVRAILDEGVDGIRASVPNGSMQCGYPALVHGIWVRAILDEINDHVSLCITNPVVRVWTPVCGVVERFGSPSVTSPNVRALRQDELGELSMMRGGCEM
jgi:hypothetical protein